MRTKFVLLLLKTIAWVPAFCFALLAQALAIGFLHAAKLIAALFVLPWLWLFTGLDRLTDWFVRVAPKWTPHSGLEAAKGSLPELPRGSRVH